MKKASLHICSSVSLLLVTLLLCNHYITSLSLGPSGCGVGKSSSCQVCEEIQLQPLSTVTAFFVDDGGKLKSNQDLNEATIKRFLTIMNALYNSGSGAVCVHADNPDVLGRFDEKVSSQLLGLLPDDSCFADNFQRSHIDSQHVVFRVKHRDRRHRLSTLRPNIKVTSDKGLKDPTPAQLLFVLGEALREADETPEDALSARIQFTFTEGEKALSSLGVFQENPNIHAESLAQPISGSTVNQLMTKIWDRLPPYVSAFCREGGSIFFGLQEEKKLVSTQTKLSDVEASVVTLINKLAENTENKDGSQFSVDKDEKGNDIIVTKTKTHTGQFLCEGVVLSENDREELRERLRDKARRCLMFIAKPGVQQDLPLDVHYHPVLNAADPATCIIEVRILKFRGLCCFEKKGPEAFKLSASKTGLRDPTQVVEVLEWLKMLTKSYVCSHCMSGTRNDCQDVSSMIVSFLTEPDEDTFL